MRKSFILWFYLLIISYFTTNMFDLLVNHDMFYNYDFRGKELWIAALFKARFFLRIIYWGSYFVVVIFSVKYLFNNLRKITIRNIFDFLQEILLLISRNITALVSGAFIFCFILMLCLPSLLPFVPLRAVFVLILILSLTLFISALNIRRKKPGF